MRSRRKLIVVMIDGIAADYFKRNGARLPCLTSLAEKGLHIERLRSDRPGTSMPGRTSIITGLPAQDHGIYGNYLYESAGFRASNPSDIRVPTLAHRARRTGLSVASIGYAMVPPAEVRTFYPPWWLRGWLRGSRFEKFSMKGYDGANLSSKDPDSILPIEILEMIAEEPVDGPDDDKLAKAIDGMLTDQLILNAATSIACSPAAPDLILTEIASTDTVQHLFGYETKIAHWSLMEADLMIGALMMRLEDAGLLDRYALAVLSDHGHSAMDHALYPSSIIPDAEWQSEGATLHVALRGDTSKGEVEKRLADFGVEPYDNSYMPNDMRARLASFVAPEGYSFEEKPVDAAEEAMMGAPRYLSSHGVKPGRGEDDRICLFAGAGIPRKKMSFATAEEVAPTLASILGLDLEGFVADPLF
jgi:predicted AlkP superfamily pyrophosphatase or phosphodiesterase